MKKYTILLLMLIGCLWIGCLWIGNAWADPCGDSQLLTDNQWKGGNVDVETSPSDNGGIFDGISNVFSSIGNGIGNFLGGVGDFFGDFFGSIGNFFGSIGNFFGGGINLNQVAEILSEGRMFTGAAYDQASGQILLFSEEAPDGVDLPPLDKDDLAVAIRAIFEMEEDPGISIQWVPEQPGICTVRYDGGTANTKFGQLMFEADLLLKWLMFGRDNDLSDAFLYDPTVEGVIPGYQSEIDRYVENRYIGNLISHEGDYDRVWFVPSKVTLVPNEDGTAFVFDEIAIDVLTESKYANQVVSNPHLEAFARHIQENWMRLGGDGYADVYPKLKQVERLARIVGIVKWLKDSGLPLDLSYFNQYVPAATNTPSSTEAITVSGNFFIGSVRVTRMLTGGITYSTENSYQEIEDHINLLRKNAVEARWETPKGDETLVWSFASSNTTVQANALSVFPCPQPGGLYFRQIDLSFPTDGGRSLYFARSYSSFLNQDLESMGEGWAVSTFRLRFPRSRQNYTVTRPNQTQFNGHWYPEIIAMNRGKGFDVRYLLHSVNEQEDPIYRTIVEDAGRVDGLELKETMAGTFELSDPLTQFTYEWLNNGMIKRRADSHGNEISYEYDSEDRLVAIRGGSGNGEHVILLTYEANRLISAEGPYSSGHTENLRVRYGYDAQGRLNEVIDPFGKRITFFYDPINGKMTVVSKWVDGQEVEVFNAFYDDPDDPNDDPDVYHRPKVVTLYPGDDDALVRTNTFDVTKGFDAFIDDTGSSGQREVDELKRLTSMMDAEGNQVGLVYTNDFGPVTITNKQGAVSTLAYDERGEIIGVTDPLGRVVSVIYYGDTRNVYISYIATTVDPFESMKVFEYNEADQLTRIYHRVISLTLDEEAGFYSAAVDAGFVTDYFYENGDLLGVEDMTGEVVSLFRTNNVFGLVDRIETPSGLSQTIDSFDAYSRPTRMTTFSGQTLEYDYTDGDVTEDLQQIVLGGTDPKVLIDFDYDSAGNLSTIRTPKEANSTITNRYEYTERS